MSPVRRILGIAFAVACTMTLATSAGAQEVVKIGFASPLTGGQANYGKDNQNGAQMAIDELNAQGLKIGGKAVKFELMAEDDQADPKMGPLVAQKLVDAKVAGVVGHFNSGVTIPASKVYSDAGIPQLSVSTNVKYTTQGYKTAFRLMADDGKQGKALGEYAVKKLGFKRLAVIDDSTAYGQGLADEFERAVKASGGQIVKHEHTNDKAVDFAAVLTSIKAAESRGHLLRRLRPAGRPDGAPDEDAGNGHEAHGRRNDELGEVHRARRSGRRRRDCVDARRRSGIAAGRQGVRRQVQGALQPGHRALRALLLRRRDADRGGDEGGQFDRSGEVPAGAREDQVRRRHRRHRVRCQGRPHARPADDLRGEERQVGGDLEVTAAVRR